MRQLFPVHRAAVDPYDLYRKAEPDRPRLRVNMIASLNGRVTDASGRAGPLGDAGDRSIFRALRALADAILVGAGTVRVEGYGPHRMPDWLAERRRTDGRPLPARIVVVSRSLDLDLRSRLFSEAVAPTVVLTCSSAPPERRAALEQMADVIVAGDSEVDLAEGLAALRDNLGLGHVLCEGGPTLNRPLFDGGLVDELCMTTAATLAGGDGPPIVRPLEHRRSLELLTLCEEDGSLFARYRVKR